MVTNCIVVGSGALGVLLVDALSSRQKPSSDSLHVALLHRRSGHIDVCVNDGEGTPFRRLEVSQIYGGVAGLSDSALLNSVARWVIFLCVPPEETEAVFCELIKRFDSLKFFGLVQFIFCNNGVLSSRCRELIRLASNRHTFVRAIFFVGAIREFSDGLCRVFRKGGYVVRWAGIPCFSTPIEDICRGWMEDLENTVVEDVPTTFGKVGFLEWWREDNADKLEREKFFTNFVLAAVIGPRAERNKTVFDKTSVQLRERLANEVACLWSCYGVTGESLLVNLNITVSATAENYNSISMQGVNGRTETMRFFLRVLQEDLSKSQSVAELSTLAGFLDASKKLWGVTE